MSDLSINTNSNAYSDPGDLEDDGPPPLAKIASPPPLECNLRKSAHSSRSLYDDMPELEVSITSRGNVERQKKDMSVQLFVSNFPYGTVKVSPFADFLLLHEFYII